MQATVLGATGYAGMVLLRILASHPDVQSILPVSRSAEGSRLADFDPGLGAAADPKLGKTDGRYCSVEAAISAGSDVVFSALPPLASARALEPFFGRSVIIDLSADFRLQDADAFSRVYGERPPREDLLRSSVYGLSELYRKDIRGTDIIANPGCYPTATLLALIPPARAGLIAGSPIVNAMSGLSGAGRKEKTDLLFVERSENANAYAPGRSHRHVAEIEEKLAVPHPVLFTPHLVPLSQGMAVTTVVPLSDGAGDRVEATLREAYAEEPFVVLRDNRIPETRDVRNSNRCDIGFRIEGASLLLFSVIDNLWKGASGQAVQNMNIRFGIDEVRGLRLSGEF